MKRVRVLVLPFFLAVGCSVQSDDAATLDQGLGPVRTLTIRDLAGPTGITVSPNPLEFATNAPTQPLHVENRSTFVVRMTGNTTTAQFGPRGYPYKNPGFDQGDFIVGVPGTLTFSTDMGQQILVPLVPGASSSACSPGSTSVLTADVTSRWADYSCSTPPSKHCTKKSAPKLLKVTVDTCDLPSSVAARIEGADNGRGQQPLAASKSFKADDDGFSAQWYADGRIAHRARITLGSDGAVATAELEVSGKGNPDLEAMLYAAKRCVPRTCGAAGVECGTLDDGCGGTLTCETCANGTTCGANGVPNRCSVPLPEPTVLASSDTLYDAFSDGTDAYYATEEGIYRVSVTGGASERVTPTAYSFTLDGSTIYYVDYPSNVWKAPKSSATTLLHQSVAPSFQTRGLSNDGTSLFASIPTGILRMDKAGTGRSTIALGNYPGPVSIRDGFAYWLEERRDGQTVIADLRRVAVTGGAPQTIVADSLAIGEERRPAVAGDGNVYWCSMNGLMKAKSDGSESRSLVVDKWCSGVAVSDDALYVIHRDVDSADKAYNIVRLPLAAGPPTIISRFTHRALGASVERFILDKGGITIAMQYRWLSSTGYGLRRSPR
ncbi:MAG TPA: hypothetical protein VM925_25710 [Labilithrix sp.]|nr:hypothetical protein [Labilithrix sp.]